MALSRKNERNLKRLRKEADRLWAEQKSVNDHARALLAQAGTEAKTLRDTELVPALRRSYDSNVRPNIDRGLHIARDAADDARVRFNGRVLPAVATVGGSIAGALSNIAAEDRDFKPYAKKAKGVSRDLSKAARKAAKEYDRKYNNSGIGVGGWFLIGAGVAAVAAVGYALWQTFRADDDLWIADEDLDAPVTTVTPNSAA